MATTSPPRRPRLLMTAGEWIAFALAMLVVLTFFYWTASTSGGLLPRPIGQAVYTDHYNLLLHGLLKGHLYLDVPVDPAMLTAANPYDPAVWVPHGWMVDASFYHGKYYIYYGVVPLLVFMLPFRLLTGGDLWIGTAGELSTVLAFLALVWLWLRVRRDYFARTGSTIVFASILALGFCCDLPSLARRPLMYEFAIASGCLFATLMLHCLYSALRSTRRPAWMLAAGVFLGLAFGSRATYLLTIVAPAWVLLRAWRNDWQSTSAGWRFGPSLRAATGFAAGFGVIGFGVLLYNYLRFSNFFDFGYNYLLLNPVADLKHIWNPSYVWFNLRNYYTHPLVWSRYYPFATTAPYPPAPPGFYGLGDVYGILQYTPIVWFLPAGILAWRHRSGPAAPSFAAVWTMIFLAYLAPGMLLLFFGTSFPRYEVDFVPPLVLVATLGACALDQAVAAAWFKRTVRAVWLVAALFSAGIAAILSVPLEGTLTVQKGNAYAEQVARVLNYPTFLYERVRGWHYGPVTWRLTFAANGPAQEKLVETPNATLVMEYLANSRVRFGLACAHDAATMWGDTLAIDPTKSHTLSASFGSLYPTSEHPYYLKHAANAICSSSVLVTLDDHPALRAIRPLAAVPCEDIHIADGHGPPGWFSGQVAEIVRNKVPIADLTPDFAPWTIRVDMPADLHPGRWPLVSAGTPDAGDLLFFEAVKPGTGRFGYFSSGSPVQYGPQFAMDPGKPLEATLWMEALMPSGRAAGPSRRMAIERDGRLVWTIQAAYHACSLESIHLGANNVSAPGIEPAFPGTVRRIGTPPRLRPGSADEHLFLRVVFPAQTRWGLREPLLMTGVPGAYDAIQVVHYGNGQGRFVLDHSGRLNQEGPFLESVGGERVHEIEIITPVFSLANHNRQPGRGTIVVKMDGQEVLHFDSALYPANRDEVTIGENHVGGPAEKRFVGALLMERWASPPTGGSN